jgi:hypothetical protein
MVIYDEASVGPLSTTSSDLHGIFLRRDPPGARFVVPDVNLRQAFGDQLIPALMPHPFPSVEKLAYRIFLRHRTNPS